MKQITAAVASDYRVTIPGEVRRLLGIGPGSQIVFAIDDDGVRLFAAPYTLETAAGSVPPLERDNDPDQLIAEAKEEWMMRKYR